MKKSDEMRWVGQPCITSINGTVSLPCDNIYICLSIFLELNIRYNVAPSAYLNDIYILSLLWQQKYMPLNDTRIKYSFLHYTYRDDC